MEPANESHQHASSEEDTGTISVGVQSNEVEQEAMSNPRSKSAQRRLSRMSLANEHAHPHTLFDEVIDFDDDVAYSPWDASDDSADSDPSGEEPEMEEYSDLTIAGGSAHSQRRPSLTHYPKDKRPIYVQTHMKEDEPATDELETVAEVPDRSELSLTNTELSSPSVRSEEELRGEEACCCCEYLDEFCLTCCSVDLERHQDEGPVEVPTRGRPKIVPFSCRRYCARNLCGFIDDD